MHGTTDNNGTLRSLLAENGGPGYSQLLSFQQSFSYDPLNRLKMASDTGGWSRSFTYDAYGNLGSTAARVRPRPATHRPPTSTMARTRYREPAMMRRATRR